ncbi:MAG: Ig-like domain-containing protein, partial [Verrucomicrobia bacterium]|nr:Ig-like domain-containing protein [Verrucomicrobiota bacterium]
SAEVNVTVIDPPTVAITSPTNNTTMGVNFTIDAAATDNGTVTSVDFYDGATLLGSDDTGPAYSYAWNGVPEGPHVLTAVAWDNDGHSATSAVVNVTVTNITWGAAQNIAGDSDVIITGTSVYAYHFGNGGPHSLNGVSFAAASTGGGGTDITIGGGAPPLFAGPYFGGAPALSAEYTTILLGGLYTASPFGLYSLMLNNLTSGTVYAVQVWSKSPYAGQHITLDGPANDLLSHNGTGQHMIGTFTATSATQTITVGPGVGDNTGGPLCAVQVRTVSGVAGYDAWSEQIPAGHRGRTDDPDGDGFTNLQEFLFGTSPIAGNGALVSSETVGGNCVLHWRQRETGAGYLLKESTTLDPGDWVTCAVVPQLDDQTGAPTDYDRYQASIPIDAARKFFRVEGREN